MKEAAFVPCSIYIDRFFVLTMAAATLGFYHDAISLTRIFIAVDDVPYFLLAVSIRIVEHLQ